jgi:hypothetical protein
MSIKERMNPYADTRVGNPAIFESHPSAQPAPVQPVAWIDRDGYLYKKPPKDLDERHPPYTPLYTTPPADMKTLQAVSDEYNAWIKHHAAGHSYDDFLQAKLKKKNT